MAAIEINFDGLPGPTHNYSGLAEGNLASERHKSLASTAVYTVPTDETAGKAVTAAMASMF